MIDLSEFPRKFGDILKFSYTSRKLIMMVTLVTLSTIFTFQGIATFSEWAGFMEWVFSIYIFGNLGAKVISRMIPSSTPISENDSKKDLD